MFQNIATAYVVLLSNLSGQNTRAQSMFSVLVAAEYAVCSPVLVDWFHSIETSLRRDLTKMT